MATVEEIYKNIAKHMVEGVMFHDELANYYDFLGLKGYKRCHEYHALEEMCKFRGLNRYFINHHDKLIPEYQTGYVSMIPMSWYNATRQDVDERTKKNAVQTGAEKWAEWEKETKKLYEESYKQLLELGEVASACKVHELICDVDCELKKAERYLLCLSAVDYNMLYIITEQHDLHEKYKNKTEEKLHVDIC